MCLAGEGAGGASGPHTSPGLGRKKRDTAPFVSPPVLSVQAPPCHLSATRCIGAFDKGKEHSPGCSLWEAGCCRGGEGEYTWLPRLGVSIISAILQMLKVIRILYFLLLQDVLMNQCGKTTGLNLMVLYINTPYYIMLALKTE